MYIFLYVSLCSLFDRVEYSVEYLFLLVQLELINFY